MIASYPGTGEPEDPGFTLPGRLERKIWRISVVPIPSRSSTPNRLTHRRYTSAGKASPAETQSRNEESWNAKEQGGAVPLKDLEHRLRGGPARIQDRLRADAHREIHVVAETIREKQLRRRERPIPLRDAEHLQPVGVRTHDHVVMEMDGPFRKSRRARRV